ncbi:MAG: hypothetical protein H0Z37_10400 [Firmicutes bacterium]|nr:hypothetical protein [Bacillota bacterium]
MYDLFCFLVTAARQLPREPDHYGPMRLAEAACRVASVAAAWASDAGDLRQVVDELMTARRQALNDPDAFLAGLDRVILRCADLERKRLAEGETPA